jgi:hypothetical protein
MKKGGDDEKKGSRKIQIKEGKRDNTEGRDAGSNGQGRAELRKMETKEGSEGRERGRKGQRKERKRSCQNKKRRSRKEERKEEIEVVKDQGKKESCQGTTATNIKATTT